MQIWHTVRKIPSKLDGLTFAHFYQKVITSDEPESQTNRVPKKFSLCLNSKSMREKREGGKGKTQW